MNPYKYNERKYAEKILKEGFLTNYYIYELKLVAKFYKKIGCKPKDRKELLYKFCEKHMENFNRVRFYKTINSILRFASKKTSKIIEIDKIPVYDEEVDYINNLDLNYHYKKVLFALLVQNKINKEIAEILYNNPSQYNFFGGSKKHFTEIKEMAKIPTKYNINKIIHHFSNEGLVEVRTRGKINLLFVEDIPQGEEVVMEITTYDNVGYYFDWYNGDKKIAECVECGKLIKLTSNRKKYCEECWREKQLKWQRESMRKSRNVDKNVK